MLCHAMCRLAVLHPAFDSWLTPTAAHEGNRQQRESFLSAQSNPSCASISRTCSLTSLSSRVRRWRTFRSHLRRVCTHSSQNRTCQFLGIRLPANPSLSDQCPLDFGYPCHRKNLLSSLHYGLLRALPSQAPFPMCRAFLCSEYYSAFRPAAITSPAAGPSSLPRRIAAVPRLPFYHSSKVT